MNAAGGFGFLAALNRRRALARLGLGVAATYAAPAVLRISEASAASDADGSRAAPMAPRARPGCAAPARPLAARKRS